MQNLLQTTDAANIFGLEKETEGKNPLSMSEHCTLFIFYFFQTALRFHFFKNYCIAALEYENLGILFEFECLFREKVQADSLKTLDNFGSVM